MNCVCKSCGAQIEDSRLVICPDCRAPLTKEVETPSMLTSEQEARLLRSVWRRLLKYTVGGLSILTIISIIVLIWSLIKLHNSALGRLEDSLVNRIKKEFEQPRIAETVNKVASDEAREILRQQVDPELKRFHDEISTSLKEIVETKERILALERELARIAELAKPPRLGLFEKKIERIDAGYKIHLTFRPSKKVPLSWIVFHARLPESSPADILDFLPASYDTGFVIAERHDWVAPNRKSARLQFQPMGVGDVMVELKVSEPTQITFQGNYGITPFTVEVKRRTDGST